MIKISTSWRKLALTAAIALSGCVEKTPEQDRAAIVPTPAIEVSNDHDANEHRLSGAQPIRVSHPVESFEQVHLELIVTADGTVASARALSGPQAFYERAVREAQSWRYRPFIRDEQPVAAKVTSYIQILPLELIPRRHVPFPSDYDLSSVTISLKRSYSHGVTISGLGIVTYSGDRGVVTGRHSDKISIDAVRGLIERFRQADFLSLNDKYIMNVTDSFETQISLSIAGHTKTVVDYVGEQVGMPDAVTKLEAETDRVAGSDKWLRGTTEVIDSFHREGLDFGSPAAEASLAQLAAMGTPEAFNAMIAQGTPVSDNPGTQMALTQSRDASIVKQLISAGVGKKSPISMCDALHNAAWKGDLDLVQFILAHGADPNGQSHFGRQTALMAAAFSQNPAVVQKILEYHPNLNAVGDEGRIAIEMALRFNLSSKNDNPKTDVAMLLIKAGANVNQQDERGDTMLHRAYSADRVRQLIALGEDLNVQNNRGRTALVATFSNEVAMALIDAGADPSIQDKDGVDAIAHARQQKWQEVIQRLEARQSVTPH